MANLISSYEHRIYCGITTFLLLGLALFLVSIRRRKIVLNVWQFITLIFIIITIPSISFLGWRLCYLPTALLHFIPFFNNIRCPTRIMFLVHLLLPMDLLMTIIPYSLIKLGAAKTNIGIGVLILFCFIDLKTKPFSSMGRDDVPEAIQVIKESKGHTLLTIPTGIVDGMKAVGWFDVNQIYFQTIHHKSLIGGYVSRLPQEVFTSYTEDSIMNNILRLSMTYHITGREITDQELNIFYQKFHPDIIYIEKGYATESVLNYVKKTLLRHQKYIVQKVDGVSVFCIDK